MTQCLTIGAMQNINLVKEKLYQEFKLLEGKGIRVKIKESSKGKFKFLFCYPDFSYCSFDKNEGHIIFKRYLANALSDLIINAWEKHFLQQIIKESCYYFNLSDKEIIYEQTLQLLRNYLDYTKTKDKILKELLEFLSSNNQIIIEGFVSFRLKEYLRRLKDAVERVTEDFLLEKEYQEFIDLLRYFIEIQSPRIDLIHVVVYSEKEFKLFNEQRQVIKSEVLENVFAELVHDRVNCEDLLLSVLISLAPRKIIFHANKNNTFILKTIRIIFADRLEECTGCDLCLI